VAIPNINCSLSLSWQYMCCRKT